MLDLEAIELIKQLKARYFRFLDTRNLEGLQTVFTSDATASFIGGDYDFQLTGWEQLEAFYKKSFTGQNFGMHNGHHPEICVDGDTATGIWYLQDIFVSLEHNMTIMGSALYDDEYRLRGRAVAHRTHGIQTPCGKSITSEAKRSISALNLLPTNKKPIQRERKS